MPRATGEQCPLRQRRPQVPRQRTGVKPVLRCVKLMVGRIEHRLGRSGPQSFLPHLARFQRFVDRGDRLASITLHIQAGNDADRFRHRLDVDPRDLSRRKQQAAFRRVVAKLRSYTEHEVRIGEQLLRRRRGERTGNADIPRMAGEVPLPLQRRRQQCADAVRQLDDLVFRVGRPRTTPRNDDRTFRGDELLDHRRQLIRARRLHPSRQELCRRPIFVVPVEVFLLQVHRQVQHHRPAIQPCRIECLGDLLGHVVDTGDGMEPRAACLHETALIHRLRTVLRPGLYLARDHHDRSLAAIRRDQ